ncbi:MAG: DUF429 domain-containing protein [Gammaproteobacteria bacterium]|nr:DUF429 domain-containing protein [Gammaproteobacteria bacterium]MBT4493940.1 DUF429 domain-containing protein [Gammaproteobacteria bacterium]MBT7369050.1 DUF429 domain-containing protein [Gammaproteobacteria bacterium]
MRVVGIDGCRGGWIAIRDDGDITLAESFKTLLATYSHEKLYVDIPMGLPAGRSRDLETAARKVLYNRRSSIFPVPCREAIYADDYLKACEINQEHTGRKISHQAWNICHKIREADIVLSEQPRLADRVFESHPELAFQCFKGAGLRHSKKSREGLDERLALLRQTLPHADDWYERALRLYQRKDLARDDIVDALALVAVGRTSPQKITGSDDTDDRGIPIRMMIPLTHRA